MPETGGCGAREQDNVAFVWFKVGSVVEWVLRNTESLTFDRELPSDRGIVSNYDLQYLDGYEVHI